MKNPLRVLLLVLSISLILVSCETTSYYGQAIAGQLYILSHRDDIQTLIDDESTPEVLREKLETILAIRRFAEEELLLPVDKNYSTYVDVERPYVVWNVFATPEFSMDSINWCYPVAGCVSYRGYFSEENAQDFANQLKEEGKDVYVGGVSAYSTLGWFSDSILNTVIQREDHQLASLIFHELAHQLLYIPGDTEFNESFATAVELEGLKRWLESQPGTGARAEEIVERAELDSERREEFVALVSQKVVDLKELYSSEISEQTMKSAKQAQFAELKQDYQVLKENWQGYGGYDAWFSRDLNNAQLTTVATYFSWVPAFQVMLQEQNGDLAAFYARAGELEDMDIVPRTEALESVLR